MEARLARLEAKADSADSALSRIEGKLGSIDDRARVTEVTLATLTERVGHLPSKGFIVSVVMTALALSAAMFVFQTNLQQLFGQ